VKVARPSAGKARRAGLPEKVEARAAEVVAAKAEFPPVKEALEVLARDSEDAEANLKVGRFRVVHQDNWDEGLPLLARSGNAGMKALAAKDLAAPAEATSRKELADAWWAAAEKEKDKSPGRRACMRRAYHWYELALPKLADKADVKRRTEFIARQVPDVADPWRHVDVSEATVKNNYIHLERGQCAFTRRWYAGGVDVTVVARTDKDNIRLTAGDGGRVIFNWEGTGGGMVFNRPDNPALDERGWNGGSIAGTKEKNLDVNKWYTLRWQLAPTGMKVWVDDELVFEKDEAYDLSARRPVGVCSFFQSAIDVRLVVVKPIPAAGVTKE
jgi:hypothetical protein